MRQLERVGSPTRAWRVLTGITVLALVLAACTGGTSETTEPAGSDTTTTAPMSGVGGGGELVIAVATENQTLEAQMTFGEVNSPGLRNVVEQLTIFNFESGDLEPMLATSWEQVEPTRWRFQLREGVSFHDGSPFNAESAAFGVNWVWSEDNAYNIRDFMGPQISAEVVDEYTIDVVTAEPDPILPSRLYFAGITSMEQVLEDPDSHVDTPIGTGPYTFVEWRRGQDWSVAANPDWWGIDAPDTYGSIFFDTVRFMFRQEGQVRASMVGAGEADIATFASPEQCAAATGATMCISAPSVETLFIKLDHANPALGDIRVREAIVLAIDEQSIIDSILGGGLIAHQIVGPSAVGFNHDLEPRGYNPDRARELLAAADTDGVDLDTPLTIFVRQEAIPRIDEVAEAVAAMLTEVGLNVSILVQEPVTFGEAFGIVGGALAIPPDRGFITIHPHGNEILDYSASLGGYYSCTSTVSTWCDPDFDVKRLAAAQLIGQERDDALAALAVIVNDEIATGYIAHLDIAYIVESDIEWVVGLDHRLMAVQMSR